MVVILVEGNILKKIQDCARKKARSAYFPSLITTHCLRAKVRSKGNLKDRYVHGCITRYDLQRLVENVELLNKVEPNDLSELESNESSSKYELEANSINDIEEAETEEEPNNPKPRVEPNVVEPVEPSVTLKLTIPIPTSSDAMNKLEF